MEHKFDDKEFFEAVEQQPDESKQALQIIVNANPTKSPESFSYSHRDRLKGFPIDLGGGIKLRKRKYVRIIHKTCKAGGWHVVVHGNVLKAKLRGDRL